jgi:branched-chain amino acid transport system ATP-binding protein
MTAAILSVQALRKFYGGVKAVNDVSFEVAPGEMVAIIGPNGAGKSTCFNALNGQIKPDGGTIRFEGRDISGISPDAAWRAGIGRTFQITATFSSMSVRENVQTVLLSYHRSILSFWRSASSRYRNEADELLDLVGMSEQADRLCGVLAYGDLKRVELAMALANKPRLLLMDEPTAGMAPSERISLMTLTKRLVVQTGVSVLFTEHDMDVVFSQADRIVVLNRGQVIVTGLPADVRKNELVQEVYLGGGTMFASEAANEAAPC